LGSHYYSSLGRSTICSSRRGRDANHTAREGYDGTTAGSIGACSLVRRFVRKGELYLLFYSFSADRFLEDKVLRIHQVLKVSVHLASRNLNTMYSHHDMLLHFISCAHQVWLRVTIDYSTFVFGKEARIEDH
jgi:hypothetical protein